LLPLHLQRLLHSPLTMTSSKSTSVSVISFSKKPRTFILTDITNEPDDAESFCRYLTYSNQFDTVGVVPTTSTWLQDKVAPEALHDILDGYEQVIDNLNAHAHPSNPYPSVEYMRSIVRSGAPVSRCLHTFFSRSMSSRVNRLPFRFMA
jgi:hypothetical protein